MTLMPSFATLQWNVLDCFIWIGIYFVIQPLAPIANTEICKSYIKRWTLILSIVILIMLLQEFPSVIANFQVSNYGENFTSMTDDKSYIEQVRRFIGLLIVLIYCTHITIQVHKK